MQQVNYFMSLDLAYYVGNELTAQDRVDLRTAKRPVEDLDMGTYVYSHPYPIKYLNMDSQAQNKRTGELQDGMEYM